MPIYVKIGTSPPAIHGLSKAAQHVGWLEVDSISLGPDYSTPGRGSTTPPHQSPPSISVTRGVDNTSSLIASACAADTTYDMVVVDMMSAKGGVTYTLTQVKVLSYQITGSGSGQAAARESFVLYGETFSSKVLAKPG